MLTKILCVDDDPITLMLCKKVIEKAEFSKTIETAKNGLEALNYFDTLINEKSSEYPEILFLDLNMPVMDGWGFLKEFSTEKYNSQFKDVKIIVLSSTIDPKDISLSKEYTAVVDFLSKPITMEMLNFVKSKHLK